MSHLRLMPGKYLPEFHQNKELIESLYNTLESLDKEQYGKRIESSILDLYFNDEEMYNSICNQYKNLIRTCSAPAAGTEAALSNGKNILVSKLPHDRYKFKVFLKPHKIKSRDEKARYLRWLDTQVPRIKISSNVKTWFCITSWNWDRRYMYVEDEQTLMMLKLKNSEVIGSIYTYEIIDKY